jgi:hypothetical protein
LHEIVEQDLITRFSQRRASRLERTRHIPERRSALQNVAEPAAAARVVDDMYIQGSEARNREARSVAEHFDVIPFRRGQGEERVHSHAVVELQLQQGSILLAFAGRNGRAYTGDLGAGKKSNQIEMMHAEIEQGAATRFAVLPPKRQLAGRDCERGADIDNGSCATAPDEIAHPNVQRVRAAIETHHADSAALPPRLSHGARFLSGGRQRLFDVSVQPGLKHFACGSCLQCAWQRNDDCIQIAGCEHVAHAAVRPHPRVFAHYRVNRGGISVGDCNELNVFVCLQQRQMHLPHNTTAAG